MLKGVKQRIDRVVIRMAAGTMPPAQPRAGQLAEAAAILESPQFLRPPGLPAPVALAPAGHDFTFPSAIASPWPANNRVVGKLFRCPGEWQTRPLILLVHGWNAELQYRYQFPLLARGFVRRGINAAMLQLPFHGPRRPRTPGAVRNFISDDIPVMLRATEQAVADLEGFLLWARAQGCPAVGIWGFSLGAWLAGLLLCVGKPPAAAALTTPVSNLEEVIAGLDFCEPIRRALGHARFDLSRLNLPSCHPGLDPSQILITQSDYDLFVSPSSLHRLEEAWNHPRIWRVPHGHISVLLAWRVLRRTALWLAAALGASRPCR